MSSVGVALAPEVRIYVSTRPRWYQLRMGGLESPGLLEHMRLMAEHDWRRFKHADKVVVWAVDQLSGAEVSVTRSYAPTKCPHCGETI